MADIECGGANGWALPLMARTPRLCVCQSALLTGCQITSHSIAIVWLILSSPPIIAPESGHRPGGR